MASVPIRQAPLIRVRLQATAAGSVAVLSWPAGSFRGALVRNPVSGQVLAVSSDGSVALPSAPPEVEVILSDGVRSETVRVKRDR